MTEYLWLQSETPSKVIFETAHYLVVVTDPSWFEVDDKLGCYCILNKEHRTIESTAHNLPIIYRAIKVLEDNLVDIVREITVKESQKNEADVVQLRQDRPQQLPNPRD